MKKRIVLILISIFSFLFVSLVGVLLYFNISLKAVDVNNTEEIKYVVEKGSTLYGIIESLEKEGLIKSALILKVYAKLYPGVPQAGTYVLNKGMDAMSIYNKIINGEATYETVWITFVEGKRLSYIKTKIAENFNFSIEEIDNTFKDKEYLNYLVDKYFFLTEDIFNTKIYHPLEGYLFPDTYEFLKDSTLKEVIEKMLDTTALKLAKYANEIENSTLNIHQIMTLASIVELEGARSNDRCGVAGVFYNRLKSGWTLGSDVTTYYAVNKDFNVDLTWSDLASCNGYNTRGTCVRGLPVGPIASPSLESIEAVLKPTSHDYYYFVADKYGKTYFNKTDAGHNKTIRDLRAQNLWYTY